MHFRSASLLLCVSCGGQIIGDADAAIPKDASEAATTSDASSSDFFECGETAHLMYCNRHSQYCLLVKTNKSHDYYCAQLPVSCTPPASSKYDCGCYETAGEIYSTECK